MVEPFGSGHLDVSKLGGLDDDNSDLLVWSSLDDVPGSPSLLGAFLFLVSFELDPAGNLDEQPFSSVGIDNFGADLRSLLFTALSVVVVSTLVELDFSLGAILDVVVDFSSLLFSAVLDDVVSELMVPIVVNLSF